MPVNANVPSRPQQTRPAAEQLSAGPHDKSRAARLPDLLAATQGLQNELRYAPTKELLQHGPHAQLGRRKPPTFGLPEQESQPEGGFAAPTATLRGAKSLTGLRQMGYHLTHKTYFSPEKIKEDALFRLAICPSEERSRHVYTELVALDIINKERKEVALLPSFDAFQQMLSATPLYRGKSVFSKEVAQTYGFLCSVLLNLKLLQQDIALLPKEGRPAFFYYLGTFSRHDSQHLMYLMQQHGIVDSDFLPKDASLLRKSFLQDSQNKYPHWCLNASFLAEVEDALFAQLPTYSEQDKAPKYTVHSQNDRRNAAK